MKHILRNERGAAIIEFALAAPILFTMIFGISQIGIVFSANAGLQHAVAEGARVAAIYRENGYDDIGDEVKAAMTDARFGLDPEALSDPVISAPVRDADGRAYVDIDLSYEAPLNFVFVSSSVTISESRRVYLQEDSAAAGGGGGGSSASGGGDTSTGGDGSTSGGDGTSGGDTGGTTTTTSSTTTSTGGDTGGDTSGGNGGGNGGGHGSSGNGNGSSGGCKKKC